VTTQARYAVLAAVAVAVAAALALAVPVAVHHLSSEPEAPPRLADLWSGRAWLVLARKWTGIPLAGAHLEIVDGHWYVFGRRTEAGACAGRDGVAPLGTEVRESTDRGRTWSPPVTILAPTPGTAWSCAATDGDADYDPDTHTWRYLFQCLGTAPDWNGCVAERHDASPLGPFSAPAAANPVLTSGELWRRICDPGDACARDATRRPVGEEGTFDLMRAAGGGWWVGFHGYDGRKGLRGIARTKTLRRGDWQVDGEAGTPRDAVLRAADATGWRERWRRGGPVGAGAASLLAQDGWTYQLAEFADENLACTPGQSWDLGLFRARSPAGATWEQPPGGNPIVYSDRAPGPSGQAAGCNVQYPRLVADPATGETFVMHGRVGSSAAAGDAIYLYRLAWDRNLLRNGDLRRADADGWTPFPGSATHLDVPRDFADSADGTPFLSFSCGPPACAPGAAVFQDVGVAPSDADGAVTFGATLRAATGEERVDVALLQLDGRGAVVASAVVPGTAGSGYARVTGRAELDGRARHLRFQLIPHTPGTVWADDLEVARERG
jgi:hypothetical protein